MAAENWELFRFIQKSNLKTAFLSKGDAFVNILMMLINNFSFIFMWWVIFNDKGTINGWNFDDMALMFAVSGLSFALYAIFFRGVAELPQYIENGTLDSYIVSPRNLLFMASTLFSFRLCQRRRIYTLFISELHGIFADLRHASDSVDFCFLYFGHRKPRQQYYDDFSDFFQPAGDHIHRNLQSNLPDRNSRGIRIAFSRYAAEKLYLDGVCGLYARHRRNFSAEPVLFLPRPPALRFRKPLRNPLITFKPQLTKPSRRNILDINKT